MMGQPNITDVYGCLLPSSPVQFFNKYGDPTFSTIDATLDRIAANANDWAAFTDLLDKDFTMENKKSSLMKTMIFFGTPF